MATSRAREAGATPAHCGNSAQQFIGSELYRRDIAMIEPSPSRRRIESRRKEFEREALRLNALGEGDMAAFYFRRA